jgi:CRP-like cAMP-binding protein
MLAAAVEEHAVQCQMESRKLSPELLEALDDIKSLCVFRRGACLFQRGSQVMGVYLVESGEVRVLLPTGATRQHLETVGPGAVLGLSESMTGEKHRTTAEAGVETAVAYIPREILVAFLGEHCDFSMQVVRLLSEEVHGLYQKFRRISAHPGRPRHRLLDEQMN